MAAAGLAMIVALGGCYMGVPGYRDLHQVEGQTVRSPPPPRSAYEEYMRARIALEREPPQLDLAAEHIDAALRIDPDDPHLWATRAEIEAAAGKRDAATKSANKALSIAPGYPPAEAVLAKLDAK